MNFDCVGVGICPLAPLIILNSYPSCDDKTEAEADRGGAATTGTAIAALSQVW